VFVSESRERKRETRLLGIRGKFMNLFSLSDKKLMRLKSQHMSGALKTAETLG
jgi:hypothetical protein